MNLRTADEMNVEVNHAINPTPPFTVETAPFYKLLVDNDGRVFVKSGRQLLYLFGDGGTVGWDNADDEGISCRGCRLFEGTVVLSQ